MNVSLTMWLITVAVIVVLIGVDLATISRKPHDVTFREALLRTSLYVLISLGFGVWIWITYGSDFGTQFFTAFLVEYSLSIDNLFVFIIILTQFQTPTFLHQRVLLIGIVLALAMRAIFIAIGATAISLFAFTFVLFGALLLWTGIQLMRHRNEDPDPMDNVIIRTVRKRYRFADDYDGAKLFTWIDGKKVATPLLLVIIAIGGTDLLFALDSIPATFGVTQEPYLVFTVNALALVGLMALYFLLRGLMEKLVYLSTGLSVILMFIGVKLMLTYFHEVFPDTVPKIETTWSLAFIGIVLVVVAVASWIKTRKDPEAVAHAGRLTDRPNEEAK